MTEDPVANPFAAALRTQDQAAPDSAGSRQSQSREMAETQTRYLMAQRFPRDAVANMDKILNSFTRPTLAEKAQYQFARGGTDIVGPSIRAAEAIAQGWGNMEQGFREISRGIDQAGVPFSEVEAYCSDLESRSSKRLQFIVRHWRDTKSGGYKLKDERDIYELIANQAQRRVRACILAMVPGDVTEAAMAQADVTLRARADTSPEGVAKLVTAFAEIGVSKEALEKRIQRRVDTIQPAQVITLKRIYASLRDDMSEPGDWFDIEPDAPAAAGLEAVRAAVAAKKAKKAGADPETGEIIGGGAAAGQENQRPKPAAANKTQAPAARSYVQYVAAVQGATDAEIAALEMDAARDDLPPDQYTDLGGVYRAKWGGK